MRELVGAFGVFMWLAGVVLAKGFISTSAAILVFPYSWYLVVELVCTRYLF